MQKMFSDEIELVPKAAHGSENVEAIGHNEIYDKGSLTWTLCMSALAGSWILGTVCIVLGAIIKAPKHGTTSVGHYYYRYTPNHDWPIFYSSPFEAELLPLLLNFIMTVLLDGLGLIHATSLRWALNERLTFNANLRLFTSSRSHVALSWPANILFAGLLILCYTSTSLLFANQPSHAFCDLHPGLGSAKYLGCGDDVHISMPALCTLGAGMLGQAALATWQYVSVRVPTWSSNPLDTAWAIVVNGSRSMVPGRCMMSVHDANLPAEPQLTKSRQRSIWTAHGEAKWIMRYVWLVLGLSILFFISVEAVMAANIARVDGTGCNNCGTYPGLNWNILPDTNGISTSAAIIKEQSTAAHAGLFIVLFLITGVVTMALHCTEMITVLTRDEVTWRHCTSKTPYTARQNAVVRAATSWPAVTLFLLKVVLHWLSGNAVRYAYNWGIFLRVPQILYLCIGMALLAAFATFLCFRKPSGPQPATFGHVQTLVNVVDEWSLLMFWGDKGVIDSNGEARHAGTAGLPLEPIVMGAIYAG